MENLRQKITNYERKIFGETLSTEVNKKGLISVLAAGILVAGCANLNWPLPTNVAKNFKEGEICTNEESINMQRIGILGESYFAIPLNTKDKILNGGEPSFALIPESKSRISIKGVGVKGGEVVVDAPEGDLYLPYVYVTNGVTDDLSTNFSDRKPVRFITGFGINNLKKPDLKNGKISLEKLTEKDLPFLDETLKTIGDKEYIVNKIGDKGFKGDVAKKILPFYLTGTPTTVEYNRAEEDGKIRIRGETFVFSKHQSTKNQDLSKNRYFDSRGFTNPIKAKAEKIIIPVFVKIDSKQ